MTLKLEARAGWPPDLRVLLEKYPREVWPEHMNLGEIARFWLDRHNGFRELGGALKAVTVDFREGSFPQINSAASLRRVCNFSCKACKATTRSRITIISRCFGQPKRGF